MVDLSCVITIALQHIKVTTLICTCRDRFTSSFVCSFLPIFLTFPPPFSSFHLYVYYFLPLLLLIPTLHPYCFLSPKCCSVVVRFLLCVCEVPEWNLNYEIGHPHWSFYKSADWNCLRKSGHKGEPVTGKWNKLHNKKLHDLYSSTRIINMTKSRNMIWMAHVGMRYIYTKL